MKKNLISNCFLIISALCWLYGGDASAVSANDKPINQPINQKALTEAETYLNDIQSLKAQFTQVAPDGSIASGTLFLRRPGHMRWQYHPPVPVVMVSQGSILRYYDYELDQISDIPIKDTLAGILARKRIAFDSDNIKVLHAANQDSTQRIRITHADQPEEGELEFVFERNPYKLRNIIIQDQQGKETNISLSKAAYNISLDDALFEFVGGANQPSRYRRR
jgi:outer membrane lipoprotein-sorting protein